MNILINRFYSLNNPIELTDLDLTLPCFKKKMKDVLYLQMNLDCKVKLRLL